MEVKKQGNRPRRRNKIDISNDVYALHVYKLIQYQLMCLQCPEQMPALTDELKKSRSLFILSLFALLCGQFMFILLLGFLAYILYLSWAEFNYSMTLNYFLLCSLQCIFVYVEFIGLIEYYQKIQSKNATRILFIIAKVAYFPNAAMFSHYSYTHFKHYSYSYSSGSSQGNNYQMIPMVPLNSFINNTFQNNQGPRYQNRNANDNNSRHFQPFTGQATTIG